MRQIFALEVDFDTRRYQLRETRYVMQGGGTSHKAGQLCLKFCLELRVFAGLLIGDFEFCQRRHQAFGNELASEGAKTPALVGVEMMLIDFFLLYLHIFSSFVV